MLHAHKTDGSTPTDATGKLAQVVAVPLQRGIMASVKRDG
jgi:hypothetical protein